MQKLILHKPEWLRIQPPTEKFDEVKKTTNFYGLNTVCQEANCPNQSECWSGGTSTFMVMGDICTRACKFCSVKTGNPMKKLDKDEPKKLAQALKKLKIIDYVVITSVDRDDLEDQGAGHFAECIKEVKKESPDMKVEVLIPDFRGNKELLKTIVDAKPEVIAHNIETVESLQKKVRDPRANYKQSLFILDSIKKLNAGKSKIFGTNSVGKKLYSKTSIMLGLGETDEEVIHAMKDLREIDVDIITFGQYLKPKHRLLQVEEYVKPEKFEFFRKKALELGFLYCASGPFVRSSYKAGELFMKNVLKGNAHQ
jgi:lipoic acid synthetase